MNQTTELDQIERVVALAGVEVRDDDGEHFIRGVVAPYGEQFDAGEYVETFEPGVFSRSIDQRGDRIALTEQHNRQAFPVGLSSSWQETNDGLVGTFRVAPTSRGIEALELTRSGFLSGLSVGFRPLRNRSSDVAGRRHIARVEGRLDHVGLVHAPAYDRGRVLEARDEGHTFDPDSVLDAPNLARMRALRGIRRLP